MTVTKVKHWLTPLGEIVLPFWCFTTLKAHGFSEVTALAWTSTLPIAKIAYDWWTSRRLDLVGCVILWEIVLTVALGYAFHSARLILLKGPIQVAALGLACLLSLWLRLPLAAYIMRLLAAPAMRVGGQDIAAMGDIDPARLRLVTMVWGVVSVIDAVIRTVLIYQLSTPEYILTSRVMQSIYFGALGVWTFRYISERNPDRTS